MNAQPGRSSGLKPPLFSQTVGTEILKKNENKKFTKIDEYLKRFRKITAIPRSRRLRLLYTEFLRSVANCGC